jgi:hypothetical protein
MDFCDYGTFYSMKWETKCQSAVSLPVESHVVVPLNPEGNGTIMEAFQRLCAFLGAGALKSAN